MVRQEDDPRNRTHYRCCSWQILPSLPISSYPTRKHWQDGSSATVTLLHSTVCLHETIKVRGINRFQDG
jgi:hypothetical protein